jgi:hypothetical protein
MKERTIVLPIIGTKTHCNNKCQHMTTASHCQLFGDLTWDPRHKYNGNKRPRACKDAELVILDSESPI